MRFGISGVNPATGRQSTFVILANDAEHARQIATQRGLQIVALRALDVPGAAPEEVARTERGGLVAVHQCVQAMHVLGWALVVLAAITFAPLACAGLIEPAIVLLACSLPLIFGIPATLSFVFASAADRGERWGVTACMALAIVMSCLAGLLSLLNLGEVLLLVYNDERAAGAFLRLCFTASLLTLSVAATVYAARAMTAVKQTLPQGPRGFPIRAIR